MKQNYRFFFNFLYTIDVHFFRGECIYMAKQYNFKVKKQMSIGSIMSFFIAGAGLLTLFFLAGSGLMFNYTEGGRAASSHSLGAMIWGGGLFPLSAGLVVAFFLTMGASLVELAVSGFRFVGFLSGLIFIAAGALYLCAIPFCKAGIDLIGVGSPSLGWASYAIGISNIVLGVLCFVSAVKGE
jgi:hypothetical protein